VTSSPTVTICSCLNSLFDCARCDCTKQERVIAFVGRARGAARSHCMLIGEKARGAGVVTSVPRRQRQLLLLVRVVDGGVEVYGDRVIARDFGGNVDGLHGEHGVAADGKVRRMR
jgi:hypothetical protein